MPHANRFRHQTYTDAPPTNSFHLIEGDAGPEVESENFRQRMRDVGDRYRSDGVSVIFLVHGTLVGGDAAGWWAGLSRYVPGIAASLREISKKWIDAAIGEHGNYTEQYRQLFEESINRADARHIDVRLFNWTSENHHLGRADAAVRLLDELDNLPQHQRIMLWGHSHAGNLFALLTHLLGGDVVSIDKFFNSARSFFRSPITRKIDRPVWQKVWQRLKSPDSPLADTNCDFVTFGTPIRYGWETAGYSGLLHVVNHRPIDGLPEYLSRFPPTAENFLHAINGDYIQQMGIAGTNVAPGILAWRSSLADHRLNKLLQPGLRVRGLYDRLRLGMRVPDEGTTLLVDYGPQPGHITQHVAGHAVYTQRNWLLFHAEQTLKYL